MEQVSSKNWARRGQVMLLTTITLSGALLGATTIAGLLMLYQIRQTTDIANSTKAIFAADGGLEWALFSVICENTEPVRCPGGPPGQPTYSGGVYLTAVNCRDENGAVLTECSDPDARRIDAIGTSGNSSRALQAGF